MQAKQVSRLSLPAMSYANLNPPDVQQYVVQHIIKNDDHLVNFTQRLRPFSGRSPRPQTESDYDIWRSGVELLLKDPAVFDLQHSGRVFDSLLPPAADMIKHLTVAGWAVCPELFDYPLRSSSHSDPDHPLQ